MTRKLSLFPALFLLPAQAVFSQELGTLVEQSGLRGGLLVYVTEGNAERAVVVSKKGASLTHVLERDVRAVERARRKLQSAGLYGRIAVEHLQGAFLPYRQNLVNLLLVDQGGAISEAECLRVLAPGGTAFLKKDSRWRSLKKPWPEGMDQWTHSLHSASCNPVSSDRFVGPPHRLQWTAGPLWARSHGWTPSVSAMVSSNGRLFYIHDETLTGVDSTVPSKWVLVARDAFNGLLLWKRPLHLWGSEAISGTPDTGRGVTVGRFTMPPHIGKRLVAVGDTVYVTLGAAAPIHALDAKTGKIQRVYEATANADEFVLCQKRLVVAIAPPAQMRPEVVPRSETPPPGPPKEVCAVNCENGTLLWKQGPFRGIRATRGQDPSGRLELCAGDGKVFLLTSTTIECLDLKSGHRRWSVTRPQLPEKAVRRLGFAGMYECKLAVLLYHNGVVLLAQPEPNIHHTYHTMPGTLYAFASENGHLLWKHPYGGWGHATQPDVFAIGETVWTHVHVETEYGFVWGRGYKARNPAAVDYRIQGLWLRTGTLRREFSTRTIFTAGHHHRCYRNRSTERFLLSSRRGIEFVDLRTGQNYQNHWVRSGCQVGALPCNGLLYVAPHPCACYIEAKLTGFNALAPERAEETPKRPQQAPRLVKGEAYGTVTAAPLPEAQTQWPTYRHDAQRSGASEVSLGPDLTQAWRASVGGRPSSVVVAGGRLYVASVDSHTVHALSAKDGTPLWSYTTGGRVPAPPAVTADCVLFGSCDGRVYCLRASDGALVWRFDAAPERWLIVAHDQLESACPVLGNVLLHKGLCWCAAGRSSYLDRGIFFFGLNPRTGQVIHEKQICHIDPKTHTMPPSPSAFFIPGLLNDIPVTDGNTIYVRQLPLWPEGAPTTRHLYATGGYLDGSLFNRTFWRFGPVQTTGPMVLGKETAYGVQLYPSRSRETVFRPGAKAYRVACLPLKRPKGRKIKGKQRRSGVPPRWERRLPMRIIALVRAGKLLYAAGPPDLVDPRDPYGAWEGRKGGLLVALSTEDGAELARYTLAAPPVFDGMATTSKGLYLALVDGSVVCFRPQR